MIAPATAWASPAAMVRAGARPLTLACGNQAKCCTASVTIPKARALAVRGLCLMNNPKGFITPTLVSDLAKNSTQSAISCDGNKARLSRVFLDEGPRTDHLKGLTEHR